MFLPNTTVTIHRSGTVDEYDGSLNSSVGATGVFASVTERSRTTEDPVSGTPRVIRSAVGRLPAGTAVARKDRVYDEVNDRTYAVMDIRRHSNPIYSSPLILELERVDGDDP